MTLTRNALGNLVNRYKAVLKKCNLMNAFGSLAVASMLVLGGAGTAVALDGIKWASKAGAINLVGGDGWEVFDKNKLSSYVHLSGTDGVTGNVSGGKVTLDTNMYGLFTIMGGFTLDGNATGNTVIISGCTIGASVYGGYVSRGSKYKKTYATGNTVILKNCTIRDPVMGGGLPGAPDRWSDVFSNNTLRVEGNSKVDSIRNFQHYDFVIPANFRSGTGRDADTLLKVDKLVFFRRGGGLDKPTSNSSTSRAFVIKAKCSD